MKIHVNEFLVISFIKAKIRKKISAYSVNRNYVPKY